VSEKITLEKYLKQFDLKIVPFTLEANLQGGNSVPEPLTLFVFPNPNRTLGKIFEFDSNGQLVEYTPPPPPPTTEELLALAQAENDRLKAELEALKAAKTEKTIPEQEL
jgi:hypothetical protein